MSLSPLLANKQDLEEYDMTEELHRWVRYKESKGFYWSLAIGGKGQSIPSDFKMIARMKFFLFTWGQAKAKVGGNDETW